MKADAAKHLPISESKPRQIGILAYPGIELLDAIGPLEVFAAANRILAERSSRNPVAYEIEIWADRLGAIDGSSGIGLIATRSIASSAPVELDTLLVAGSPVSGVSLARAMICCFCASLNVGGAPGRGASQSRCSISRRYKPADSCSA
jgi:transcriptional regulator GlxA family with amidase domain